MPKRFLVVILFVLLGCTQVNYIGSTRNGNLREVPGNKVTPAQALEKAGPHLAQTFELRCQKVHNNDEHWCKKEAADYIVQKGDYYHITRTSYPYKTFNAYVRYAVRVHVQTGAVIPPETD